MILAYPVLVADGAAKADNGFRTGRVQLIPAGLGLIVTSAATKDIGCIDT